MYWCGNDTYSDILLPSNSDKVNAIQSEENNNDNEKEVKHDKYMKDIFFIIKKNLTKNNQYKQINCSAKWKKYQKILYKFSKFPKISIQFFCH